jgi:hypothetical protein
MHHVGSAHRKRTVDISAGADDAIVAEGDLAFDDGERSDFDVFAELDFGRKNRSGVNSATFREGQFATPIPWVGVEWDASVSSALEHPFQGFPLILPRIRDNAPEKPEQFPRSPCMSANWADLAG